MYDPLYPALSAQTMEYHKGAKVDRAVRQNQLFCIYIVQNWHIRFFSISSSRYCWSFYFFLVDFILFTKVIVTNVIVIFSCIYFYNKVLPSNWAKLGHCVAKCYLYAKKNKNPNWILYFFTQIYKKNQFRLFYI